MTYRRYRFLVPLLLLSALIVRCKSGNDPEPNSPPSAFTIKAQVIPIGADIVLTWTKAKDPEGDRVTYTVVWKDTLTRYLTDTTYTLRNVGYNTSVVGSVIARDARKAATPVSFSVTVGAEPYVSVPDPAFEKLLIELKMDSLEDGRIKGANALKVSSLDLSNKNISRLDGIEGFINLKTLDCSFNNLTRLDISKNTALTKLYCNANKLTSLNVSPNTALTELDCSMNQLSSLDMTKNGNLTVVGCAKNSLTKLDISKNTRLVKLYCTNNKLSSLDISANSNLTTLWCFYNAITSLNTTKNPLLQVMQCFGNNIQTICVANLSRITSDWQKDESATYQICQ
ncbi:leucine-rich repeat domain-containing protein [Spirosoma aerolatum]|uniref:leucine-rich repeat domain-containing protein n=1 Tax=Spirosoma aerolatum TaxID=1211326 RepID=UPI0009AF1087|nr:leucine-rich repeat domain-containing protein [Spirosoma aerolatum]